MMKGNKYLITILTFIQNLHFCTSQKLKFDRDVAIKPIGNGLFSIYYGGVLDYFDKHSYDNKKNDLKSVSLYDSRNTTLGRVLR